jgi:hypothetical protein
MRTFPAMAIVSPAIGGAPVVRVNAFAGFNHDGDLISGFANELAFRFLRLLNVELGNLIEKLGDFGTPGSLFAFGGLWPGVVFPGT